MDAAQVIDGAIDYIQKNGWCQGDLLKPDGSACLRGALFMGAGAEALPNGDLVSTDVEWYAFGMASRQVEEEIEKEMNMPYVSAPDYNDEIAKSQEDVLLILKRARGE